ncbi:MAG: hypothetical protein JWN15_1594, partial [Firmicutes bacterium]|nr:hypothetical protein [Bacillota bacterium]
MRRSDSWRQWLGSLLCLVVLMLALPVQAESQPIGLVVDGQKLAMDVPPLIVAGRTLVPLRAIMEALGARVEWNQGNKTATVFHEGHVVALPEGSGKAVVDGAEVTLDVPAQTVSGRMLVPVRFLVEATGGEVDWSASDNTVYLAVKNEALKTTLRITKANRELPGKPPELWKAASEMDFQLTAPSREYTAVDGVVHVEGRVAARLNGARIVLVVQGPNGRGRETTLPIGNGMFSGDIQLVEGAGSYTIEVYAPTQANDGRPSRVTDFRAKNVSTRLRQSPYYPRGYAESGLNLELPTNGQIAVDTAFGLRGTADVKLNGRFLWLEVEKGSAKWSSYVQIRDGKFDGQAHLGGGAGLHWVTVLLQDGIGSSSYAPVAYVPVMNTGVKAVRQPLVVMPFGQEAQLRVEPLPDSVPDGYVPVAGQLMSRETAASVLVRVTRGGEHDDVFIPLSEGRFAGRVPLALGAGDYELSFMIPWTSMEWREAATAHVTNQAVQVVRGFRYSAKAIEQNLQLTAPATDPSTAGAKLL